MSGYQGESGASRHFPVPDSVQQSQARRDAARNQHRPCAGDAGRCRRPARHRCSRYGGAYCAPCWVALDLRTDQPDPERTLPALQRRAREAAA